MDSPVIDFLTLLARLVARQHVASSLSKPTCPKPAVPPEASKPSPLPMGNEPTPID